MREPFWASHVLCVGGRRWWRRWGGGEREEKKRGELGAGVEATLLGQTAAFLDDPRPWRAPSPRPPLPARQSWVRWPPGEAAALAHAAAAGGRLGWMDPEAAFGEARRSLEEAPHKGMDALLSPAAFAAAGGPCRNHSGAGPSAPPAPYPALDGAEPAAKQCIPCPAQASPAAAAATTAAPFSYGCFGSGYCSYRVARGSLKPCPAPPPAAYPPADKYVDACNAVAAGPEDYQPRPPAEFAFYPGYAGPYQPVANYLDVSVVQTLGGPPGDARHEALLPVDPYHQPWALAGGWNNQVCCPKEQSPAGHFWKTAFAGNWPRGKGKGASPSVPSHPPQDPLSNTRLVY